MSSVIGQIIEGSFVAVLVFYLFRNPAETGQLISSISSSYVTAITALQGR